MLASFGDSEKLSEDGDAAAAASSLLTSVAGPEVAALCSRRHEEGNMVKRLPRSALRQVYGCGKFKLESA